jgi:lipid-A-disaccharide synthase
MKYYVIAGEASGDLHASNLIAALKRIDPAAEFRAWGGDRMKAQGAVLVKHIKDLAFMGFMEVVSHLPQIMANIRFCQKDLLRFNPDVLILVDYPGFNLRIAEFAGKQGIRVFYYISPQLWAWKASRVKTIKKYVQKMFVILPFEKEFYQRYEVSAEFTGHPLLDVIHPGMQLAEKHTFLRENGLEGKPIIALLPGSRKMEIRSILGTMLKVVDRFPEYQFVIGGAPSVPRSFYHEIEGSEKAVIVFGKTYDLLACSEAALVGSGTATLETALMDVPQLVCYRGNPLSYAIARKLVKVPFISLVNLIAGKEIVKELIQDDFTPESLETELKNILSPGTTAAIRQGYSTVRNMLGGKGASERTAALMVQYLKGN